MYKKIFVCIMMMTAYSIANSDQLSDELVLSNNIIIPQNDDFWQRLRAGFRLDRKETDLVRYYEKRYTQNPKAFQRIMTTAKPYIYYVLVEAERNGFPSEIALLPIVESSYNPFAVSPAGISTGMWQFVGMTGKRFNLAQTSTLDERQDVVKSTKAAIKYLGYLNDMFARWDLTLAAYNWGEGRIYGIVQNAQKNGDSLAYADLPFRDATKNYVPKLVALANIIDNPRKFGVSLDSVPNQPYFAIVSATPNSDTQKFIQLASIDAGSFKTLNPQFKINNYSFSNNQKLLLPINKQNIYAMNTGSVSLPVLAAKTSESVSASIENASSKVVVADISMKNENSKVAALATHIVVTSNEDVATNVPLSSEISTNVASEGKINDLIDEITLENKPVAVKSRNVDTNNVSTVVDKHSSARSKEKLSSVISTKFKEYKVKSGDTLYSISKKFNVGVDEIKHDNRLNGNTVHLYQILRIR